MQAPPPSPFVIDIGSDDKCIQMHRYNKVIIHIGSSVYPFPIFCAHNTGHSARSRLLCSCPLGNKFGSAGSVNSRSRENGINMERPWGGVVMIPNVGFTIQPLNKSRRRTDNSHNGRREKARWRHRRPVGGVHHRLRNNTRMLRLAHIWV